MIYLNVDGCMKLYYDINKETGPETLSLATFE